MIREGAPENIKARSEEIRRYLQPLRFVDLYNTLEGVHLFKTREVVLIKPFKKEI